MKIYLLSFGAGLLVGVIYYLIQVRSPAPPVAALIGLLGMLVGEQIIPVSRQALAGAAFAASNHTPSTIFSASCRDAPPRNGPPRSNAHDSARSHPS
jgi:XapX domain-containing protein